ncbi:glycosyltransferase family 2 protein [Dactylosporangium sp. NPDC000521]|uniref:glycosyltransferase family 2 protein n=1 Tax=Dactylosporangium sp. NPDC000521 TaxID=3363975 RepID=UPI0036A68006
MKVSVVLPCYNAGPALGRCLDSLRRQDLGGHALEVVVVDDGSTDGTARLAERSTCDLVYLHKPRTAASGRSAARNTGIRHATGDLVVMIDPDHVFPPDFLARHVRHHERRADLVVAGPRHRLGEGEAGLEEFLRDRSFARMPAEVRDVRVWVLARLGAELDALASCWLYAFSCNLSVRREHLLAVGGFDEGFTGWGLEDSELGYRLRRHGLAFVFEPDAVLYTWERGGMTARRYADWRRNLARFTAKHPGADVAALRLLDDNLNPDVTVRDGVGRYVDLEHAVRAAAPR